MKNRIISTVVSATILLSSFAVPTFAQAQTISKLDGQISFLQDIGVIRSDIEDYTATVKRDEFADMVMHTYYKEVPTVELAGYFNDVIPNHTYKDSIDAIGSLGFMKGTDDGVFGAEEEVTCSQAVIVMLRALNCETYINALGGWENNYIKVATDLKLLKNFAPTDDSLTYEDAVVLLYNALNAPMIILDGMDDTNLQYEKNSENTLMSERLDLYEIKGLVSANRDVSLDGSKPMDENKVVIDGKQYLVGTTDAYYYLGQNIIAYYDDETDTIRHIKDNNSKIRYVEDASDAEYSAGKLSYFKGNAGKTFIVDDDALIVYNTSLVRNADFDASLFDIEVGNIKIIEDSYQNHDVIIINAYTDMVYDRTIDREDDSILINKFDSKNNLIIEDFDKFKFVDEFGKIIEPYSLKSGAVLSVAKSLDGSRGEIIAKTTNQSFIHCYVSGYDEESVRYKTYNEGEHTYDEVDIKYTKSLKKLQAEKGIIKVHSEYVAYIDTFGLLAYMDLEIDVSNFYAYIIKIIKHDDNWDEDPLEIRVFRDDGKVETYSMAKKVTIDGVAYTDVHKKAQKEKIAKALGEGDSTACKLVYASLNFDSFVVSIDTCPSMTVEREKDYGLYMSDREEEDTLYKMYPGSAAWAGTFTDRLRYSTESKVFNSGIFIGANTIIMAVPRDDEEDASKYKIATSTLFINDREYKISGYARDDNKLTPDIIVYEYWSRWDNDIDHADGTNLFARAPFQRSYDNMTAMVNTMTREYDEDLGEVVDSMTVTNIPSGSVSKFSITSDANVLLEKIEKGDIVRYTTVGGSLCYLEKLYSLNNREFSNTPRVMRWQNGKELVSSFYVLDNDTYLADSGTTEAATVLDYPTFAIFDGVIMTADSKHIAVVSRGKYDSAGGNVKHNEWNIYQSDTAKVYIYDNKTKTYEKKTLVDIISANEDALNFSEALVLVRTKRATTIILNKR